MYLESNTRPGISSSVRQCAWFIHNTKASHGKAIKKIFWYIQVTKYKGLVFNISNKLVVDCFPGADLSDCGDMVILKTLFGLGVGLYLW